MTDEVQFDEENTGVPSSFQTASETLGVIEGLVIKTGIAKDKTQANIVLVIIIIVAALISLFLLLSGGSAPGVPKPSPSLLSSMPINTPH